MKVVCWLQKSRVKIENRLCWLSEVNMLALCIVGLRLQFCKADANLYTSAQSPCFQQIDYVQYSSRAFCQIIL